MQSENYHLRYTGSGYPQSTFAVECIDNPHTSALWKW